MKITLLRSVDWRLVAPALILSAFGLLGIWSTCVARQDFSNFEKQAVFLAIGLVAMLVLSMIDYRALRSTPLILSLFGLCIVLLLGLHFFAPVIKGTRGWYKLWFLSFDPIEPTKIVFIMLLAKYFSGRHVEMYRFRHIILSGVYAALAAFPVFIKPDLGGTMIFLFIWLGILLVSGIKVKHFLILLLCFVVVASAAWVFLLHDYQKERITAFLFPYDYYGAAWNQNQTRIAIGSGGLLGQGLANGSQVQYRLLPEPHTDFIFSVVAEEWGMAGVLVLFFAYGYLVWQVVQVSIRSSSNFPRLFALGFAIMLTAQFFTNIGMNVGVMPVVGIYLPFVSYGGSGLIANFLSLGILQSISRKNLA